MKLENIELRKLIWVLTKPLVYIQDNKITIVCYDEEEAKEVYDEMHQHDFKRKEEKTW